MNDMLEKLDIKNLGEFDKFDDLLVVSFSLDKKSKDYISPKSMDSFMEILRDEEYPVICLPKQSCVTKETLKSCRILVDIATRMINEYEHNSR